MAPADDAAATDDATRATGSDPLAGFHPAVARWFRSTFHEPTAPQRGAWPGIRRGESTLVFAPTGTGKTLAAFLGCIDRLATDDERAARAGTADAAEIKPRCRVVYLSPLKALASDVERNLQAPLIGIDRCAHLEGTPLRLPTVAVRTGDTPQRDRARFARHPADILITTPESLFLLLTSQAREALRDVETVIVDEIHALVPTKRGAHLALSLARLEALTGRRLQRIGLSATQRPLDEVARFLGGCVVDDAGALVPAPVTIIDARKNGDGGKQLELVVEHTLIDEQGGDDLPRSVSNDVVTGVGGGAQTGVKNGDIGAAGPSGPTINGSVLGGGGGAARGTWKTIPKKLVALAAQHRTTLVFVNSRRLTERLAAAVNDEAGSEIAAAHHGSLARVQRTLIEERLKAGLIQILVCTSSLELGVDMGSVDVVVQVEAPPTIASALQRVGRAGHQVGAVSRGVIFPRFTSDLLACAATTAAMREGAVEATHHPRNPLDILAQQIVAMVARDPWHKDELFAVVRRAAPFSELPRASFDSVLDLLSGKTALDLGLENHEALRARLRYDRATGILTASSSSLRLAVQNAGTIPDRGLYGVFLAGSGPEGAGRRVGELDEEMVFETRPGEVFRLGASTWRVEEITHDRVLVSPAPGEPGKLPFWRGEQPLRPLELGERMGALTRTLIELPGSAARAQLMSGHGLVEGAADKLVQLLMEQKRRGGGVIPDDRTLVVERGKDELGDWRLCLLSPLGAQVLQPLALALVEKAARDLGVSLEMSFSNDGIVLRFPDGVFGPGGEEGEAPDLVALLPKPDDVEGLVLAGLAGSAMFAARFRESAGRALLLPKRRPGTRAPLWRQRQRAQDLLSAVQNVGDFPLVLETCREILRDVFDLPALTSVLEDLQKGSKSIVTVDVDTASPFAAALLSGFIRGAIYDGDVPLAERRAQALAIDHDQLRALLGEGALRELLDDDVIAAVEALLQQTDAQLGVKNEDGLHDLLLRLGDLRLDEIALRTRAATALEREQQATRFVDALVGARQAVWIKVAGEPRVVGVEDVGRYRDALGVPTPPGIAEAWLVPTKDALNALVRRFVKSHALTTARDVAARFAVPLAAAQTALSALVRGGVIVEGAFRPGGDDVDHADPDVLRTLRRRTLARLRQEVEPTDAATFVRARSRWQGLLRPRHGLDGLLDVVAALQGTPLLWSTVERDLLPARLSDFRPEMLDALAGAGEIVWVGAGSLGERDGRVLLFLADDVQKLWRPPSSSGSAGQPLSPTQEGILATLGRRGATFYADLVVELARLPLTSTPAEASVVTPAVTAALPATVARSSKPPSFAQWQASRSAQGAPVASPVASRNNSAGGRGGVDDELWALAFSGLVTNDTFRPLRARLARASGKKGRRERASGQAGGQASSFRSRRQAPPLVEGRWSLLPVPPPLDASTLTRLAADIAVQLVRRDGLLTRDAIAAAVDDGVPVTATAIHTALKMLEESGRLRRGYFVADLGGLQYADPAAVDELRRLKPDPKDAPEVLVLGASDPGNPFGAALPWPTAKLTTTHAPPTATTTATTTTTIAPLEPAATRHGCSRTAGAHVVLVDGHLAAFVPRGGQRVTTFLPDDEPERSRRARAVASSLASLAARRRSVDGAGVLLTDLDGLTLGDGLDRHPLGPWLVSAGFVSSAGGFLWPRLTLNTPRLTPPGIGGASAPVTATTDHVADVSGDEADDDDDDDSDDDVDGDSVEGDSVDGAAATR